MTLVSPAAILRGVTGAAMIVVWAALAHLGSAASAPSDLGAAVAVAPLAAVVVTVLWRTGSLLWPAVGACALIALATWLWPVLRANVALLYYIQHVGTNLALGTLFGRSLIGAREPLVTRFARMAHNGPLRATKVRYTRQVTLAWTAFFAAMAVLSTGLFVLAPPAIWSLFANLLTMPLLALMFAAEHLVRVRVLPPEDNSSIGDTIRGYRALMRQRHDGMPLDPR